MAGKPSAFEPRFAQALGGIEGLARVLRQAAALISEGPIKQELEWRLWARDVAHVSKVRINGSERASWLRRLHIGGATGLHLRDKSQCTISLVVSVFLLQVGMSGCTTQAARKKHWRQVHEGLKRAEKQIKSSCTQLHELQAMTNSWAERALAAEDGYILPCS